ncbi:hypothetical protein [Phycicoccus sp. Soil748]|uniref:hypothetical protein n=1 Tax=Phycicoccus sp. Soil748 TaxID=1736397 RepID=UPI0009ECA670|nr:hypothetical protein [Phycicoccus sp. Soil748]
MSTELRLVRTTMAALGALVGLYGVVRFLGLGWTNLLATLPWLAGVVVVHDGVLAPLVVVAGVAAARTLPAWSRPAAVFAVVVLGAVTLVAVPVLGRFGAKADNPTLLDRPYAAGWVGVAVLVLVAAVAIAVRGRRKGAARG